LIFKKRLRVVKRKQREMKARKIVARVLSIVRQAANAISKVNRKSNDYTIFTPNFHKVHVKILVSSMNPKSSALFNFIY